MKLETMPLPPGAERLNDAAIRFCNDFVNNTDLPRYVLGRNEYAKSILEAIDVDGIVDDYTIETQYLGKPILRMADLAPESLVVSVVIGRPFTALERLKKYTSNILDYFAFEKYSGLPILPIKFWPAFRKDFVENNHQYKIIHDLLSDSISKKTFMDIINFRYYSDLSYMTGYTDKQASQYFEPFLPLNAHDEMFVDIGGYDGMTSLEFIRRYPDYKAIYLFEPDVNNIETAKDRLKDYPNISFFTKGLSDTHDFFRFRSDGSTSKVSEEGDITIEVERLDVMLDTKVTYLKMDIEGGERAAIEGAKHIIQTYSPTLALCVYHRFDDLWKIPKQIFEIRDDYHLYLRHYTEGVDETVMFFIPEHRFAPQ